MRLLTLTSTCAVLPLLISGLFLGKTADAEKPAPEQEGGASTAMTYSFKAKNLKRLGPLLTVTDRDITQTVEATKMGYELWSLEFEYEMALEAKELRQVFRPAWVDLEWGEGVVQLQEGVIQIQGFRADGKGLLKDTQYLIGGGTTKLKGDLIFSGSTKGKKLSISFLSAPTIVMASP